MSSRRRPVARRDRWCGTCVRMYGAGTGDRPGSGGSEPSPGRPSRTLIPLQLVDPRVPPLELAGEAAERPGVRLLLGAEVAPQPRGVLIKHLNPVREPVTPVARAQVESIDGERQ